MVQEPASPPPLRAAVAMVVAGILLLLAGLVVGDERWQVLAWVLGGVVGGTGALTLAYARVAPHVPLRGRHDRR